MHGGKRKGAGRPVGTLHTPNGKARIKVARLLEIAHNIAENKDRGDPKKLGPRVSMIATLLRKELPDMSASDITSKGKRIVVERTLFKQPVDDDNKTENNNDADADRVPDPDDR